ncbi:MAG TPA: hypothetical protein VG733_18445 [Chthoniobacteraceae bacterium]|nr:hypothetical protein [Chthoniobacteraceae bacterium]
MGDQNNTTQTPDNQQVIDALRYINNGASRDLARVKIQGAIADAWIIIGFLSIVTVARLIAIRFKKRKAG